MATKPVTPEEIPVVTPVEPGKKESAFKESFREIYHDNWRQITSISPGKSYMQGLRRIGEEKYLVIKMLYLMELVLLF